MRARPRSARARTEGNNRLPDPQVRVRGLRPRTFRAKRRTQDPLESAAFERSRAELKLVAGSQEAGCGDKERGDQ
jgi:hypothetical protein